MTLVNKLRQKLADTQPSDQRHDIQVADPDSGSAVHISAVQRDGLSLLAWELRVKRVAPPGEELRQWADQIAARVTSLLQPLQVLEVDTLRNQALLRSVVAAAHKEASIYFEILLDGTTTALVRRYQAAGPVDGASPSRREQVAFALTNEGLLKLIADIVE